MMMKSCLAVAVPLMLALTPALAKDSGHPVSASLIPAVTVSADGGRNDGPDWNRCRERQRRANMAGTERFCLPSY